MPPLTSLQLDYFNKKLKDNFTETICETHFNSLNYNIEKVEIESITQTYVKRSNLYNTNFFQEQLNKTPDFYNESANLIKIYKSIILKPEYVNDVTNEMSYDEIYRYKNLIEPFLKLFLRISKMY